MIRDERNKRVLIKISGEALQGDRTHGIDPKYLKELALEIKEIKNAGIEIVIVLGGGNIFRGMAGAANGMDRSAADYMGMLATIMNGVAMQDALESTGLVTRLMTALELPQVGEHYLKRRAERHLEKQRIVICAGGTGNPFFTTDTAGVLRARELSCDMMIKATMVDGVYDKDPREFDDAKMYKELSYQKVLQDNLRVMDHTAVTLSMEGGLTLKVTNLSKRGAVLQSIIGDGGTTIKK